MDGKGGEEKEMAMKESEERGWGSVVTRKTSVYHL